LAEKEAESFLEKRGFKVVEGAFVRNIKDLENSFKKIGFLVVMKASGKKIIHKKKIGGVITGIDSYKKALDSYIQLKKIKGFEGVVIQKQISGKEILLGLKKTPEFGHVLVFGHGGSNVEKKKDVAFRVCPLEKKDFYDIFNETKIGKILNHSEKDKIIEVIKKLCSLSHKYPKIFELDINPLIVNNKEGYIVDSRIVFD